MAGLEFLAEATERHCYVAAVVGVAVHIYVHKVDGVAESGGWLAAVRGHAPLPVRPRRKLGHHFIRREQAPAGHQFSLHEGNS